MKLENQLKHTETIYKPVLLLIAQAHGEAQN